MVSKGVISNYPGKPTRITVHINAEKQFQDRDADDHRKVVVTKTKEWRRYKTRQMTDSEVYESVTEQFKKAVSQREETSALRIADRFNCKTANECKKMC